MNAWGLLFLGVAATGSAFAQQAPFCVINSLGNANCFYYNLEACRQAARSMNGMCAANSVQQVSRPAQRVYDMNQAINQPDFVGDGQRAFEAGQRQRQSREEHVAKMKLLEAQTAAVNQGPQAPIVLYKCPGPEGVPLYTSVAAVGCLVVSTP